MLKELRQKSSEVVLENPYWQYRLDRYELGDGSEAAYHYAHTPGSVMVIPITDSDAFVMVRQYRYLNRRESIEFPGGGVKSGLGIEASAHSELREETGSDCRLLTPIGSFNPMNGLTDELCSVFVATGLKPSAASPDKTEEFIVEELSYQECLTLIANGKLWDGMTLAALAIFAERRSEFFQNK